MILSYLILANYNAPQVARIMRRINTDGVLFFVHVDRPADTKSFEHALREFPAERITYLSREFTRRGGKDIFLNDLFKCT